jgi:oligoendopeptidase F
MKSAWKKYYGDSLSEYDGSFWKSKLHFYKTGISFYNFPYTFGYLFSMGVYAQRSIKGAGFFEAYTSMLMDTGRMTVEELASRHLGVDVTKRDFWKAGIDLVDANVTEFERLI